MLGLFAMVAVAHMVFRPIRIGFRPTRGLVLQLVSRPEVDFVKKSLLRCRRTSLWGSCYGAARACSGIRHGGRFPARDKDTAAAVHAMRFAPRDAVHAIGGRCAWTTAVRQVYDRCTKVVRRQLDATFLNKNRYAPSWAWGCTPASILRADCVQLPVVRLFGSLIEWPAIYVSMRCDGVSREKTGFPIFLREIIRRDASISKIRSEMVMFDWTHLAKNLWSCV